MKVVAIIISVTAIGLATTGAASSLTASKVVHVHSGDRVVVNNNLGCFVGPSNIVCGGSQTSRISADIRTDGEIVIQAQPTPHGVYPEMFIKRAECTAAGVCDLVVSRG